MLQQSPFHQPKRGASKFDITVRSLVGLNLFLMALEFIPVRFQRGNMSFADFFLPDVFGIKFDFLWFPASSFALFVLMICTWILPQPSSSLNTGLCLLELVAFCALVLYAFLHIR